MQLKNNRIKAFLKDRSDNSRLNSLFKDKRNDNDDLLKIIS